MPNTSEYPDLELILRGRPVDLPPVRVQIVTAAPPRREMGFLRFAMQAIRRHWRLLGYLTLAGLLAGLALHWALTPLYTARTSVEVIPPANAEALIKGMAARRLTEAPSLKLDIQSLPEYTRSNSAINLLRRVVGLSAYPAIPSQEEFLGALESRTKVTQSAQGHVIDIEFQASDPSRAAAFLDLLTEEIARDQSQLRTENAKQVKEVFAPQIAQAHAEMQKAEEELVVYSRSVGMTINVPANLSPESVLKTPAGVVSANRRAAALRAEQAVRLAHKQQTFESKRSEYESMVRRAREAEVENANAGGVRRLAPAQVSGSAKTPGMLTYALLGAISGLLLAVPLCLVLEAAKRTVRDEADLTHLAGIPPLGVIPHASFRKEVPSGRHPNAGIIDLNPEPGGPGGPAFFTNTSNRQNGGEVRTAEMGESFRQVLASIWIAGQNTKRPRVLLFASPEAKEGKTTIVANLGIALAHTRRRVLLVEADLRAPQIHAIFGAPARWGLANLLEEDDPVESYSFDDLVFKTDVPGLYVLPAGHGDLAIAGMRHIDRLTELLLRFRLEFHAVLIDTPAVSDYPDARIVARLSDAVVMVLRANETSLEKARALARQFEADGTTVLGAVLNDCKASS